MVEAQRKLITKCSLLDIEECLILYICFPLYAEMFWIDANMHKHFISFPHTEITRLMHVYKDDKV